MADIRESVVVAAPADVVYAHVADLPRMGEWSPECEKVTWCGGVTAAAKGAHFLGHNRTGAIRWMTQGEVVTAERGRHLAFEIRFGPLSIARWEYFIVPHDDDPSVCTIVEEWTDRRPGWYRTLADKAFGPRTEINQHGIVETLANLKGVSEAAVATGGWTSGQVV